MFNLGIDYSMRPKPLSPWNNLPINKIPIGPGKGYLFNFPKPDPILSTNEIIEQFNMGNLVYPNKKDMLERVKPQDAKIAAFNSLAQLEDEIQLMERYGTNQIAVAKTDNGVSFA
jgi:hypothetical protein